MTLPSHWRSTGGRKRWSADPAGFSYALYQSTLVTLKPGHRVELVNNGAVFDRLEQSFAKAERSINIVLFIWRPGLVSERLERAIAARTKRGVTCRVLVDPMARIGHRPRVDCERLLRAVGGVDHPAGRETKTGRRREGDGAGRPERHAHLSVVGSVNFDWLSMRVLEEGALVMSDPRVVDELVKAWEADVALCVEVP